MEVFHALLIIGNTLHIFERAIESQKLRVLRRVKHTRCLIRFQHDDDLFFVAKVWNIMTYLGKNQLNLRCCCWESAICSVCSDGPFQFWIVRIAINYSCSLAETGTPDYRLPVRKFWRERHRQIFVGRRNRLPPVNQMIFGVTHTGWNKFARCMSILHSLQLQCLKIRIIQHVSAEVFE